MMGYQMVENVSHLDTIPACDGQTDRQTDAQTRFDGKDRDIQSIARVKTNSSTEEIENILSSVRYEIRP